MATNFTKDDFRRVLNGKATVPQGVSATELSEIASVIPKKSPENEDGVSLKQQVTDTDLAEPTIAQLIEQAAKEEQTTDQFEIKQQELPTSKKRTCSDSSSGQQLKKPTMSTASPSLTDPPALPVDRKSAAVVSAFDHSSQSFPDVPEIKNRSLFSQVFTHPCMASKEPGQPDRSYEALEFIGDAYIELAASRLLHLKYGVLPIRLKSSIRESLVCNENLAKYSKECDFHHRVNYVRQKVSSINDKTWTKILADVFEAYAAAVVEDDPVGGFAKLEKWLIPMFERTINEAESFGSGTSTSKSNRSSNLPDTETGATGLVQGAVGANSQLARPDILQQSKKLEVDVASAKAYLNQMLDYPLANARLEYRDAAAPKHILRTNENTFTIGIYLTGWGYVDEQIGLGQGTSKKRAGANAAVDALTNNVELVADANRKRTQFEMNRKRGIRADFL